MPLIQQLRKMVADMRGRYDILAYARRQDNPAFPDVPWFVVKPGEVYPATINRILDAIQSDELPAELIDHSPSCLLPEGSARSYLTTAKFIPEEAWDLTLHPPDHLPPDARQLRAQALELARRWFVEALHNRIGQPIGVTIEDDPDFKL